MRYILYVFLVLIFLCKTVEAQISEGGYPLEASILKSNLPVVEMPPVNNLMLQQEAQLERESSPTLKPMRFAHGFDVDLSPDNSGIWVSSGDFLVWKLIIRSPGAKSLNLIFDQFHLPNGARLFLFNSDKSHILGAFTSFNNKKSGKFAVSPVAGDELHVQYEIPRRLSKESNFIISAVNHDFVGLLKYNERRPLNKTAGLCNIDVNCFEGEDYRDVKDAVCRLIVNGREVCSGALVNNTREDNKPYVISAAHCYDSWEYAETTVYTFNYESPYCAPLDGDPSRSISGAIMRAQYDSLDFALTELSLVPPPEYHPFYAGWSNDIPAPLATATIHHPQGDVKKISIDNDPPVISDFDDPYIDDGFIQVLRWEAGVTENGSSGGPLFNTDKKLIGMLTGGVATCANPVRDYFSRFDLAWDYKSQPSQQLKYWLDPLNTGVTTLSGKRIYTDEYLCAGFTNLQDDDLHYNVPLTDYGQFEGYWGGTNTRNITEFMERFTGFNNAMISGISMGVGKIVDPAGSPDSEITLKIYDGGLFPEDLIYSQKIKIKQLAADAMNFFTLNQTVLPADTFFVGFELSNMQPLDTFVIYQSLRNPWEENNFFFKRLETWESFVPANLENRSMTNVIELLICDYNNTSTDSPLVNNPLEILLYPNPANSSFTMEAGTRIDIGNIDVFNMLGQQVNARFSRLRGKKIEVDLNGNVPGIYFVRFDTGQGIASGKISYVPW